MNELFEFEVRANRLDIERATAAYIPLLEQCYRLAREEPVVMPPGYQVVSQITANVTALAALATGDGPAPQAQPEAIAMMALAVNPEKFGFIVRETETGSLLVVVRGTLAIEEWLRNFTAIPTPYDFVRGFGLVHLGFEAVYGSVRSSIFNVLRAQRQTTRITLVGHSLGGAMVTLAAPDIAVNLQKPVDVFTVGSPRVGKPDFRANFNARIVECFRVTNQLDIVPHVPTLATFWRHVGEEVEVSGKGAGSAHSLPAYLDGLRQLQGPQPGPTAAALGTTLPAAVVVP